MKKIIFSVLILLSMVSCIKDDTTGWQREFETVTFHGRTQDGSAPLSTSVWSRDINMMMGETVTYALDSIKLTDKDGNTVEIIDANTNNPDYKFEWIATKQDDSRVVLSEGFTLTHEVVEGIGTYEDINFVFTRLESNLSYYYRFMTAILSELNDGLVVIDTKDGATSEFHQVKTSYLSTNSYSGEDLVYTNLWAANESNGGPFQGIVKSILYESDYYNPGPEGTRVFILKEGGDVLVHDANYKEWLAPNEMFVSKPTDETLIDMTASKSGELAFIGDKGNYYHRAMNMIGAPHLTYDREEYNVTSYERNGLEWSSHYVFDATKGRILSNTGTEFLALASYAGGCTNDGLFSYDGFSAFDCIYMGPSKGVSYISPWGSASTANGVTMILREKSNPSALYAYKINPTSYGVVNKEKHDISASQAVNGQLFTSSMQGNILFYVTNDNELRAVNVTQAATNDVLLETFAGEKITKINIYTARNLGILKFMDNGTEVILDNERWNDAKSTQGRLLQVVTHNESTGNGKVYLLPIRNADNPTVALEDKVGGVRPNTKVIEGDASGYKFGRITATCLTADIANY